MENTPVLEFVNPGTGEKFGQVAMCTAQEVRHAMHEMRRAQKIWEDKPVKERVQILRQFQQVMIDSLDEITAVMNQDCGKSRQDALIEVFITIDMLNTYLKHAPHWLRRRKVSRGLYWFKTPYIEPRPYGVVGVIAPWNYPFALSMPAVLAALLAGNTVLLKPSEVTAATGVMIEGLFQRIPELTPYVRVLHGDGRVGAELVQSRPDYIFMTGSTATGFKVAETAARYLIPTAFELGGKDAMIVLEDADVEAAARWGAWGAHFNAGQTCMAVERVYVVKEVYDQFLRHAVAHTNRLKVGYNQDLDSPFYLGPITDPRQLKIIDRHLEDALAKGARVLTGGKRHGNFYEPTVLVDVTHDMLLMKEETFGPLLPVMKVEDEEEAIRLANDNSYGLSASIWSRDLKRAQRLARRVEAGSVVINDTIAQFALPMLPFGGIKGSGYGRTHGKQGLLQFTQAYAYLVGDPPKELDLTVLARRPGNYNFLKTVIQFVFGVTPQQKLEPVQSLLPKQVPQQNGTPLDGKGIAVLGAAVGVFGALSGILISRRRSRR